jgi:hypothetical protein
VLRRDDLEREPENVDQAGLTLPLSFGLVSVLTARLRQPLRRWLSHRRARSPQLRRGTAYGPSTRRPDGQS